ncbi:MULTISPECIES: anti-sigma regulatory factor [Lysinibacillus]|uniref:Serine/threonine-protein kinase RsbT n=1 Tax=Lysinibacillus fusiformis TaxID=28031 RepID=A0A1H9EKS9_9BACI|nr:MULTISPECIES: anti-sigma regulatory factor [Lysinibacillus]AXQ50667.1 anti-sigma regulatory factor [Stenotrophomonas rhizophila]EAZ85832.1 switch protein/serine-threonine kinase [Bacillus sp. B14905]AJK86198.1 serine/threonine protein kinase [Lysinibacillus fusiformis]KAB0445548.1 anti-sigma regulatory factor [Lysinibacillus fusiformis]KEK11239.1 serine/threonine protein kinase [Lysinibacillus sphaericus]
MTSKSSVEIITEWDIITARQLGRNEAKALGFGTVDQARITTAISELARNIYLYASIGIIEIERIETETEKKIVVVATDQGPGIKDIRKVTEDGYSTSGGLGAGLPGVKRLMDSLHIQSVIGEGTTIRTEKWLR